jgi:hypothetical protein
MSGQRVSPPFLAFIEQMTLVLLQRQVGRLHQFQHQSSCFFNGDRR